MLQHLGMNKARIQWSVDDEARACFSFTDALSGVVIGQITWTPDGDTLTIWNFGNQDVNNLLLGGSRALALQHADIIGRFGEGMKL